MWSQVYSISNIKAKQQIQKNMLNELLFFFQLWVGIGKRVREHVSPRRKQIYFEFHMRVLPGRDFPLQNGGMTAINFGESHFSPQARSVGTRSSESISGSESDIVHVPG